MAMTAGGNAGQCYCEINMTPLIDVMLVLLIIFIFTLPIQTDAIKIDNPLPHPREPLPPPDLINLQIDFDGTLLWNRTAVDRETLQSYISAEAKKSPSAGSAHHGGQVRQLSNGRADPGRFAAARLAKDRFRQ